MRVVPFPVPGTASSGTVVFRVPYWNWTLYAWSHFRYRALPVPVRLCLEPVLELDSMRVVPFPVPSPASSGTVIFRVPYWNWTLCTLKICHPLHKVDVNYLLSVDVRWPCNDHGTVSIDKNSIRLFHL